MVAVVSGLFRYPVKGLSAETLASIELRAGRGVPGDRAFAFALPATVFDAANPQRLRKFEFLMLARQEALARLTAAYDASSGILSVSDGHERITESVRTAAGREAFAAFFARFLPEDQKSSRPRLCTAANHCFTDVVVHSNELIHAVSMLNLASVRDLEARIDKPLDPRRFRANILVEGLDPWAENGWLERDLIVGTLRCKAVRMTRRCPTTEVTPETAVRDVNVPQELIASTATPVSVSIWSPRVGSCKLATSWFGPIEPPVARWEKARDQR
jgi:uncharacterized protein